VIEKAHQYSEPNGNCHSLFNLNWALTSIRISSLAVPSPAPCKISLLVFPPVTSTDLLENFLLFCRYCCLRRSARGRWELEDDTAALGVAIIEKIMCEKVVLSLCTCHGLLMPPWLIVYPLNYYFVLRVASILSMTTCFIRLHEGNSEPHSTSRRQHMQNFIALLGLVGVHR